MKKLIIFLLLIYSSLQINANQIEKTFNYLCSDLIIGENTLPIKNAIFCLPFETENIKVEIIRENDTIYMPESNEFSMHKDKIVNSSISPQMDGIYEEFYISNKFHLICVPICPAFFDQLSNEIILSRKITVKIDYISSHSKKNNEQITFSHEDLYLDLDYRYLYHTIENTNDLVFFYNYNRKQKINQSRNDSGPFYYQGDDDEYTYFLPTYTIITNRYLAHSFRKIVALKRLKGINTDIIYVEDIMNHAGFINKKSFERIKLLLDLASGGSYVLLGGDTSIIPAPKISSRDLDSNTNWFYSDFLYSSNSYLTNHYGTFPIDSIYDINSSYKKNFYPTCSLGRINATSPEEVDNYSNKLISYELNLKKENFNYLDSILDVNCGLYLQDDYSTNYTEHFYDSYLSQHNYQRIEQNDTFPTGNTVINMINNCNYGLVGFHGVGSPEGVLVNNYGNNNKAVVAIDTNNSYFDNENSNGLNNIIKNKPFVSFATGGLTMPLPKNGIYYNFGQSILLGKGYGAVAFIGNSGPAFDYNDGINATNSIMYKFFGEYEENIDMPIGFQLGLAKWWVFTGNKQNSNNRYTWLGSSPEEIITRASVGLLGDPEIELRNNNKSPYNNINIIRTGENVSISGLQPKSIVSYVDNNNNVGRHYYANSNTITLTIPYNSSIMISNMDHYPYIAPLYLQNDTLENNQYVFASEVKMGRNVDASNAIGDLVIADGTAYEIEASGDIYIDNGTIIKSNASLRISTEGNVYIQNPTIEPNSRLIIEANKITVSPSFTVPKTAVFKTIKNQ